MTKYSSYIVFLLISILVVIVCINGFSPIDNLQRSLNDKLCRMTSAEGPRPNIVLVEIDGRTLDQFGSWPWNRDLVADLTAAVASGEPKAIVLDVNLGEDPEQDSAGYTDILAGQLSWIQKVVLPYDIALASYRANRTTAPPFLFNNSISVDNPLGVIGDNSSLLTRKVFLPAEKLMASNTFLGFEYLSPDNDRKVRHQPLVMHFEGYYYPSVALRAAALYLNVAPSNVRIYENSEVSLNGSHTVPIGEQSGLFIRYSSQPSFTRYSAADILGEGFDYTRLQNKLVLIGLDQLNSYELFETPAGYQASGLQITATVADNIINNNTLAEKAGYGALGLLILFALGGLCAFLLPRVVLKHRMIILLGCLFLLANVSYFLVSSFHAIVPTLYYAVEILLFMVASPLLDSQLIAGEAEERIRPAKAKLPKPREEADMEKMADVPVQEIKEAESGSEEENQTAAINQPAEESFADYQAIQIDEPSTEATNAIDAVPPEKQSRFDEEIVGESDASPEPEPADPPSQSSEPAPEPSVVEERDPEPPITDSQKTALLEAGELKNLGRYQVTGVLGKGAMGLVYRGVDPAINRPVALKTIRLDFVNDPEEMAELKERLHREAQAAGKLSHPNIVTIYDVGSEGQLQYIAMEFLEGVTLEDMIKKNTKFNYRIIAQIIIQICSALEYAHEQGIIHRDIKPANIMVLKDYRVKVMDYGIARIDSNSMTKTGIAMGTPNYISPEQLKGLQPDRRGDIFSLGVVMYEMLLGRRPFRGENITALIYSIINTEPEKPSNVNPQIPLIFDRILEKALHKDPAERFQRASEVADSLKDFVESFAAR